MRASDPPDTLHGTVAGLVDRHAGRHRGLAVAVDAAGGRTVQCRGSTDAAAIFEIGSITKVFTATLLAVMAGAGEVGLDEPVEALLPAGVRLPVRGRPITLADLAAHRSGLPRVPASWLWRAARAGANPYALFDQADLWAAAARSRRRPAGGRPRYSNFGAGLLGDALAHRAGRPYADLVTERVCGPLGLGDTAVHVPAGSLHRLAQGHDRRGRPVPAWDFPVLAGAGALRSTAGDLLAFLRAQDAADAAAADRARDTPLLRAVRATHAEHARRGALGQCLGWMSLALTPGSPDRLLWHNGGTGGFRSFCAVLPGAGIRVAVLAADAHAVDRLGQDLVRVLRGHGPST